MCNYMTPALHCSCLSPFPGKLRKKLTLTVSVLAIPQRRRHGDDAPLPHAHAQKTAVHAGDQPPDAHVGIVGSQTSVTAEDSNDNDGEVRFKATASDLWQA